MCCNLDDRPYEKENAPQIKDIGQFGITAWHPSLSSSHLVKTCSVPISPTKASNRDSVHRSSKSAMFGSLAGLPAVIWIIFPGGASNAHPEGALPQDIGSLPQRSSRAVFVSRCEIRFLEVIGRQSPLFSQWSFKVIVAGDDDACIGSRPKAPSCQSRDILLDMHSTVSNEASVRVQWSGWPLALAKMHQDAACCGQNHQSMSQRLLSR